jgi:hypothetical protein
MPDGRPTAPRRSPPALNLRCAATLVALLAGAALAPAPAKAAFEPVRVPEIVGNKLFDLGVADIDDDGALDIFSVNHKFPATGLVNEGGFTFSDGSAELGLSPEPQFPGLERVDRSPVLDVPGLYAHFRPAPEPRGGSLLRLRSKGRRVSGHVSFSSHLVNVERSREASYSLTESEEGAKELEFDLARDGELAVRVIYADLPMRFEIRRPERVFVGADAVVARSGQFEVRLPDRHGYVFAPIGGSPATDLFVVGGGLNGAASRPIYADLVADEALIAGRGNRLHRALPSPLPAKNGCRGRAGAAVDADSDGDIDLFSSCDGDPFQLSLRAPGGSFVPAPPLPYAADAHVWIDAGGDRGAELVTAKGSALAIWRLRGGRWTLVQRIAGAAPVDRPVQSFATADVDGDLDLDLLALSGGGSTLLLREGPLMRTAAPQSLGLPGASVSAAFADIDNDGDQDAHFVPQGLLVNGPGGYDGTGRLQLGRPYAIASWPDLDLDGRRDLLLASGGGAFDPFKQTAALRNRERSGHWLEIDLQGPAANPDGIGAVVDVRVEGRTLRQWVGQNEGSRYSQGNYRTYFGLGQRDRVERIVVRWPDGRVSARTRLDADRLVTIDHPANVKPG